MRQLMERADTGSCGLQLDVRVFVQQPSSDGLKSSRCRRGIEISKSRNLEVSKSSNHRNAHPQPSDARNSFHPSASLQPEIQRLTWLMAERYCWQPTVAEKAQQRCTTSHIATKYTFPCSLPHDMTISRLNPSFFPLRCRLGLVCSTLGMQMF
jgi:hypothetical protein